MAETIKNESTARRLAGPSRFITIESERSDDFVILASRLLLTVLFVMSGWSKLIGFGATIHGFTRIGVPLPMIAACVAVLMELLAGSAIALGLLTRPLAVLLAIYTLGTALLGHRFWTMSGAARMENEINFLKNMGLIGGFFLLYVTGAGRYSVDAWMHRD